MKNINIIIALFIVFASCKTAKPVSTNSTTTAMNTDTVKKVYSPIADSLGYMNEIKANKQKYINKEFSVLLNDLKIPIKSYFVLPQHNRTITTLIDISFDDAKTTYFKKFGGGGNRQPVQLQITWDKPILTEEIYALQKKGLGEWTSAETEYFSKLTVADIW